MIFQLDIEIIHIKENLKYSGDNKVIPRFILTTQSG